MTNQGQCKMEQKHLFQIYKKYSKHCDKGNKHSYISFYEGLFLPYRDKLTNLLEVGVYRGPSLNLWRDYFYNCSNIVGVDISKENLLSQYTDEWCSKIDLVVGDSTNENILEDNNIKDFEFDIIIDDGDHSFIAQSKTFDVFYDKLKKGGLYIIEDVLEKPHGNSWEKFKENYSELNPIYLDFIDHRKDTGLDLANGRSNRLIVFYKK
jgi:hypothetical protein